MPVETYFISRLVLLPLFSLRARWGSRARSAAVLSARRKKTASDEAVDGGLKAKVLQGGGEVVFVVAEKLGDLLGGLLAILGVG